MKKRATRLEMAARRKEVAREIRKPRPQIKYLAKKFGVSDRQMRNIARSAVDCYLADGAEFKDLMKQAEIIRKALLVLALEKRDLIAAIRAADSLAKLQGLMRTRLDLTLQGPTIAELARAAMKFDEGPHQDDVGGLRKNPLDRSVEGLEQ